MSAWHANARVARNISPGLPYGGVLAALGVALLVIGSTALLPVVAGGAARG
jgi:hypothetical protein